MYVCMYVWMDGWMDVYMRDSSTRNLHFMGKNFSLPPKINESFCMDT